MDGGRIDLEKHRKLLEKLASDDEFRARFEKNPQAALAEHGIHVEADQVPTNRTLPSKEEIRGTLDDRLKKYEEARSFMVPLPIWTPDE